LEVAGKMQKQIINNVIRLNLGCGKHKTPGFVNIDLDPNVNPDMVFDLSKNLPYPKNSVHSIFASHILEHLHMNLSERVLKNWYDVLKKDGILEIMVPNLTWAAQRILEDEDIKDDWILKVIYGGEWNGFQHHQTGFTPKRLTNLLERIGFKIKLCFTLLQGWNLYVRCQK
jgi:predicted SAM-dependent methyltransferase